MIVAPSNQPSTIGLGQLEHAVLSSIKGGVGTWYGVIGTSIESGTSNNSWARAQRTLVPNLISIPVATATRNYVLAEGGALYADNGGTDGISETQLDLAVEAFNRVTGPKLLDVGFGFNDMTGSGNGTPATFVTQWNAILARCRGNGIACRFIGPLPGSTKPTAQVVHLDRLLALWCAKNGVPYVHVASLFMLPTTGLPDSALTDGTVHPNHPGSILMAQECAKNLLGELPTVSPWIQASRADYNSGTNHGLSQISNGNNHHASTASTSDTTGYTDTTTGGTVTRVAAPGNVKGFSVTLTRTGAGTLESRVDSVNWTFGSNVDEGDILTFAYWITTSGMEAADAQFSVRRQNKFTNAQDPVYALRDIASPVFIQDSIYVDNPANTGLRLTGILGGGASGPVANFGGLAVVNITKLMAWGGI